MSEGDIGGILDSLTFEAGPANYTRIVHAVDDIYAVFYVVSSAVGRVATIQIGAGGSLAGGVKDTYDVIMNRDDIIDIVKISTGVCAIVYSMAGTHGKVETIAIDSDGLIDNTPIDDLEFETTWCTKPKIIHVVGIYYAISYADADGDGKLVTVSISDAGEISNTIIDFFVYDTVFAAITNIIKLSDDLVAITLTDTDTDGLIYTIGIDAVGLIAEPVKDRVEFETDFAQRINLVQLGDACVAIVYQGPGADGWMKTFAIDAAGLITEPAEDSEEFDEGYADWPHIIHISGNVYAIIYEGVAERGWIRTFTIALDGQITDTPIDEFVFDAADGLKSHVLHISGDVYVITYTNDAGIGLMKTVDIETTPEAGPALQHLMLMGIG